MTSQILRTIKFFLPMVPPTATKQQRQINWERRSVYDASQVKEAKAKLEAHLAKYIPDEPLHGGVRLITKWLYPRGASHGDGEYKITRPDIDNMPTLLFDCMTRLRFWEDDARVASLIIEKFWANTPGIYIELSELEEKQ